MVERGPTIRRSDPDQAQSDRTGIKIVWSLCDQVLVSGTRFGIALILARNLSQDDFGAYVIGITIYLVLGVFQSGLICHPLTVLGAPMKGPEFRGYVSCLIRVQTIAGLFLVIAGLVSVRALPSLGSGINLQEIVLGLTACIFFAQMQEFIRRVLFTKLSAAKVFANDLLCYLPQIIGTVLMAKANGYFVGLAVPPLSGQHVFLLMGCASSAAGLLGLWQIRNTMNWPPRHNSVMLIRTWQFGRWGLVHQISGVFLMRANHIILGLFGGLSKVAVLEASRLLVAPILFMSQGVGNILGPRAAGKYVQGGQSGLGRLVAATYKYWGLGCGLYALVLAMAPRFWLVLLLSEKYQGTSLILFMWLAQTIGQAMSYPSEMGFYAVRRPDIVTKSSMLTAVMVVSFSFPLIWKMGIQGAILAMLVGSICLAVWLAFRWRQQIKLRGVLD